MRRFLFLLAAVFGPVSQAWGYVDVAPTLGSVTNDSTSIVSTKYRGNFINHNFTLNFAFHNFYSLFWGWKLGRYSLIPLVNPEFRVWH